MTGVPQMIVRRRTPGWRMPEGAIYVGRPTRWANPFRIEDGFERDEAVGLFAIMLAQLNDEQLPRYLGSLLHARYLACWCEEGDPCHGDVLVGFIGEYRRRGRDTRPTSDAGLVVGHGPKS